MPTVLIVDDEKNILRTLSMSLRRNSFQVRQARNGLDALKLIQEEPCDYVISDVRMSPMDGFTLSEKIYDRYPWIDIILMSAYAFEESDEQKIECCPYDQIKKPFEINELVQLLKDREQKRIAQKRIAYWGDASFSKRVCFYLKKAGFQVFDLERIEKFSDNHEAKCDLYLIDSHILESDQWKLLNQIDSNTPYIPVVILAESNWKNKKNGDQGSNIIVLDRHEFLSNPEAGMKEIQSYLK